MGQSLADYAAAHPESQQPPQERQNVAETAATIRGREEAAQKIKGLKESIAQQIEQGRPAQAALYMAIGTIGICTNDTAWSDALQQKLDGMYWDIRQQAQSAADIAEADRRLQEITKSHTEKLKRQTQAQIRKQEEVTHTLLDLLNKIEAAEITDADNPFL